VRRTSLILTGLLMALVLVGLGSAPAGAQYGPGGGPGTIGCDGGTCTVGGCPPGSTANVSVDGTSIGSFPVGADGTFSFADPGSGTVTVSCDGVTLTFELGGTVTTASGASGADLARTGSDSAPLLRIGIALAAVGGIVLLAARRRLNGLES
jgi:hypothetical protein